MARFGHLLGVGLLMTLEVSLYHMQISPKANQEESFGLFFLNPTQRIPENSQRNG